MTETPSRGACPTLLLVACVAFFLASHPIRAQVVINEILGANRFGAVDEDGDTSDWAELVNVGGVPIDLDGYGLSDDPRLTHRWTFPRTVLDPGERLLVWCSGKNRFQPPPDVLESEDSPAAFSPDLVSLEHEWRYLAGAPTDVGPPAGWSTLEFDDGAWSRGRPGFGFDRLGAAEELTTLLPEGSTAAFFRGRFRVNGDVPRNLVLRVRFDDGFMAYLNGVLVAGHNFRDGEPTFASDATSSHSSRRADRYDISQHLHVLRPGENVLAMVALNSSPASRDMVLFPELGSVAPILHTSFRLDRRGEYLALADRSGATVDSVAFRAQEPDRSFGRFPDGVGPWYHMLIPTPGETNDERVSAEPIPGEVRFEPRGGVHDGPVDVVLDAGIPFEGVQIHYAINGAAPTLDSPQFDEPLGIRRDVVISAAVFLDGERVTPISRHSFFVSPRAGALTLPIMSIAMDPTHFRTVHLTRDGRGRTSERPAHMEILDESGQRVVATGFGMRLHGGAGRGGDMSTKKAYRAYFRRLYGAGRLRYRVIPDTEVEEFDKLVLRSNFNDAFRTGREAAYIRDQLIRDLHQDMGALVSHGSWYNLYINGQYRGVYNVVERMDRVFFGSYLPEEGENWDVVKTADDVLDGDSREWRTMLNFIDGNDLAQPTNYERARELIDVENFTDYMILNIWAQNHDWPQNNWYAARPRRPDGRWIFLSWDAEFGIGRIPPGYTADTLTHVLQRNSSIARIFASLLRNRDYQRHVFERFEMHLEGALSPENVLARIERLRSRIERDMDDEAALSSYSIGDWRANIASMERFAERRNDFVARVILASPRFRFTRILSVNPTELFPESAEDAVVTINGIFFTPRSGVLFGVEGIDGRVDLPAPAVERVSGRRLVAAVPFDLRLEGDVTVTVDDPVNGAATLESAVRISYTRPRLTGIRPPVGSPIGGERVRVTGAGFTEDVRVEFGGVPSPSVTRVDGSTTELDVVTPPGTGVVPVRVINTRPGDLPSAETLEFAYEPSAEFLRGDTNGDGSRNVSDVVGILRYLFASSSEAVCRDALDVDDSGRIDITDPLVLLDLTFGARQRTPAEPYRECGRDPTPDRLGCAVAGVCEA